jgi:hypothetical protein
VLSIDDCLWLLAVVPIAVGLTIMWNGCEGERTILWVGNKIAVHEDCCCCPQCDGCLKTPWVWGTVELSGIVGYDIAGSPPPLYACTDPETETEDYCKYGNGGSGSPNGLNDTTFEVECRQLDACSYVDTGYAGPFCGLDNIEVDLYFPYGGGDEGVWISLHDNEPSPTDWSTWFEEPDSYPIDCSVPQSPAWLNSGDDICDFDNSTATFTPLCEEPS